MESQACFFDAQYDMIKKTYENNNQAGGRVMATFVGAEYIIANLLIAMKKKHNRDSISLEELSTAGVYIQRQSLEKDIDAIFLSSTDQLSTAIYDFSDYFQYDPDQQEIFIVKTKKISDLESRFIGYLPFNVLTFLVEAANEAVCFQI